MGTDWLNANLMEWFQYVDPCPTADQFVQMCSATKFGGEQNPLTLGGVNFMLTGVIGGLHYLANQGKIQELRFDKQEEPAVDTKVATPYIFANTLFPMRWTNYLSSTWVILTLSNLSRAAFIRIYFWTKTRAPSAYTCIR